MDTEQHKVTVNLISPHTMPPVLENPLVGAVTGIDLPTISVQKAEKLPIRDVPAEMNNVKAVSAREVDKAAVRTTPLPPIDMTIIASSSKTKVEDLNWRVGTAISKLSHRTPHRSTAYSRSTSTPSLSNVATISVKHNVASGTIIKRKLEDAFEIFETPSTKRKRTIAGFIEPLAHVPSRKRMLSDALESFELPAKKRKRYNDPESSVAPTLPTANCQSVIPNDPELPVAPTLPTVNCQPVISAPVDPLPIKKRKRDDAVQSSETKRRRREGDVLSSVAQSTTLPTAPLSPRKPRREDDIEAFTPEITSTPVKQRANDGDDLISFEEFEAERNLSESIPRLEEERGRAIINLPVRKRRRAANVFAENDA